MGSVVVKHNGEVIATISTGVDFSVSEELFWRLLIHNKITVEGDFEEVNKPAIILAALGLKPNATNKVSKLQQLFTLGEESGGVLHQVPGGKEAVKGTAESLHGDRK